MQFLAKKFKLNNLQENLASAPESEKQAKIPEFSLIKERDQSLLFKL